MKFSTKGLLVFLWIALNLDIFASSIGTYAKVQHYENLLQTKVTHNDVVKLSKDASREQVDQFYLEEDLAIRGLIKAFILLTETWICTALLNVILIILYFYVVTKCPLPATEPRS